LFEAGLGVTRADVEDAEGSSENVTSIDVSPRGRRGRFCSTRSPITVFWSIRRDSPWQTTIRTTSC